MVVNLVISLSLLLCRTRSFSGAAEAAASHDGGGGGLQRCWWLPSVVVVAASGLPGGGSVGATSLRCWWWWCAWWRRWSAVATAAEVWLRRATVDGQWARAVGCFGFFYSFFKSLLRAICALGTCVSRGIDMTLGKEPFVGRIALRSLCQELALSKGCS
jgi:hypothetical protein